MKENGTESKAFSKSIMRLIPDLLFFFAWWKGSYVLWVISLIYHWRTYAFWFEPKIPDNTKLSLEAGTADMSLYNELSRVRGLQFLLWRRSFSALGITSTIPYNCDWGRQLSVCIWCTSCNSRYFRIFPYILKNLPAKPEESGAVLIQVLFRQFDNSCIVFWPSVFCSSISDSNLTAPGYTLYFCHNLG